MDVLTLVCPEDLNNRFLKMLSNHTARCWRRLRDQFSILFFLYDSRALPYMPSKIYRFTSNHTSYNNSENNIVTNKCYLFSRNYILKATYFLSCGALCLGTKYHGNSFIIYQGKTLSALRAEPPLGLRSSSPIPYYRAYSP